MSLRTSQSVVDALRQRIQRFEKSSQGRPVLPFGIETVDSVLPGGGLALGAVHEVAGGGNGAISADLPAAVRE